MQTLLPKQPKTGQREEKSNDKTKDASSRTGVSRKAGEAGIFVDASLNGYKVKLLIDTGATLSIISPDILNTVVERAN